jgi:hypothetical protein
LCSPRSGSKDAAAHLFVFQAMWNVPSKEAQVAQKKKNERLAARRAVTRELIPKAELTSRATNFKTLHNEPSC